MPDVRRRLRAAIVVSLAAILLIGLLPATTEAKSPPGLERFMWALGRVESGGRYAARNPRTGAYGKYQILPSTWHGWARAYLGSPAARPTPRNQELVAHRKATALWNATHDWRLVAHAWLTGHAVRNTARWSATARRYVRKVMTAYGRAPTSTGSGPAVGETAASATALVDDRSGSIVYAGGWASARYGRYVDGAVHYATARGASASFTFVGRKVVWYGPVGPTRGQARVYVDGVLARTVSLYAPSFRARTVAFSASWASVGTHTLRIEVVGTRGHPVVALDAISFVH